MLLKIVYLLVRQLPGVGVLVFGKDVAKDAALLVLRPENAVLRRHASQIRSGPAGRIGPAALAPLLPRRRGTDIVPVTPAALRAWHRKRAARKHDTSGRRRPARPPAVPGTARLGIRLANENPRGGHRRIHGERATLGAADAPSTLGQILHAAGTDPSPARPGPAGRQFLHAQAAGILAAGFVPGDTVLLRRLSVLVFTGHGTRRRHAGGVTANPAGEWTGPHARHLARTPDRRFEDIRVSLRDRGPNFTASFDAVFPATGAKILISAVPAPRRNATGERLTGTLRREAPGRILIPGERHLRAVVTDYQVHDNTARPHQGIAPRVPGEEPDVARATLTGIDRQQIRRKPVLGGLINQYTHAA